MLLTTSGSAWREPDHGRRPPRRTKVLAAAFMVGALLLAACSDDNDSSGDTTPTDATTAVSTGTPTGPPLVFGYLNPGPGLLDELATAQKTSLDLAVADIDAASSVNGQPVKVMTAEEAADGDPTTGLDSLLDQGASIILGPVGSASRGEADPVARHASHDRLLGVGHLLQPHHARLGGALLPHRPPRSLHRRLCRRRDHQATARTNYLLKAAGRTRSQC